MFDSNRLNFNNKLGILICERFLVCPRCMGRIMVKIAIYRKIIEHNFTHRYKLWNVLSSCVVYLTTHRPYDSTEVPG